MTPEQRPSEERSATPRYEDEVGDKEIERRAEALRDRGWVKRALDETEAHPS